MKFSKLFYFAYVSVLGSLPFQIFASYPITSDMEKDAKTKSELKYEGEKLYDEGAKTLSKSLSQNASLTHLNANNIGATDEGTSDIVRAIRDQPLKKFHVSFNKVGQKFCIELSTAMTSGWRDSLISLGLTQTGLDDGALGVLSIGLHACPNLEHLLFA